MTAPWAKMLSVPCGMLSLLSDTGVRIGARLGLRRWSRRASRRTSEAREDSRRRTKRGSTPKRRSPSWEGGEAERPDPGRDIVVQIRGSRGAAGRHGRAVLRLLAVRHRGAVAVRAVGPVEELHPATGDEQDLGREPVAVLVGLRPAARPEFAVDVDQPALPGVLREHRDEPVLEGDDAVPLSLVDPLARLLVEVGLVGRDRQVRHAPAGGEVVDGDVGAEVADEFHAIESERHGISPLWSG